MGRAFPCKDPVGKRTRSPALGAQAQDSLQASSHPYRSGDLLFCAQQASAMEQAIGSSTGAYTHVAMVEVDSAGQVWVIEASRGDGVRRVTLDGWDYRTYCLYRLAVPFDTAAVVARAKRFIGQPYDDAFLPDNGQLYCSELVYEAYLDSDGNHLFSCQPMNFRDSTGGMPQYWETHFGRLGIAIPEGVSGTNPTDLARSPLLTRIR